MGGSQSELILTGNLTDLNDFLNDTDSIDYEHATPNMSDNNVDLITIKITDNGNTGSGGGGTITLGTVNIDITAANEAPTAGNNTVTTNENTTYTFSASDFNFSDIDGDTLTSVKITSPETVGSLQLSGGDVSLNQVITWADIDAGNLKFAPVADENGVGYDSFDFKVNDGTVDSVASYTITIDVTAVNDAPTVDLNGFDGGGTDFTTTFTEDGGAVNVTDSDAIISDADDTFFQYLGINLFNMLDGASEKIVVAGYTFTCGTGDVVTSTVGSTDFEIDFDATGFSIAKEFGGNIPLTDLQMLLRGITYENTSQNPTTGNRVIELEVQDAAGLVSPTATSTITVDAQNDAPVLTTTGGSMAYTEQAAATVIDAGIALVDPDGFDGVDPSDQYTAVVQITGNYEAADTLGFTNTSNMKGVLAGDMLTLSVIGGQTATIADFQAALRTVTFYNGSDTPNELNRTITFSFDDGVDSSNLSTKTVQVTAVNDDPTNTGSLPTDVAVTEDVTSSVDLSAVNFSDVDVANNLITVTLSTSTGGRIWASSDFDVTVFGSGTGTLTLIGGVADLNNFFSSASRFQYLHGTPHTNGDNADTIKVEVNDGGNTGSSGGGTINLGTVNVDITAVNDVPVATGNTVIASEDLLLVIRPGDFNFTDVESDSLSSVTITGLNLNGGTLTHSAGAVTVTNGMTITAAQLADLTFTSALNDSTDSSFTYTVNDAGTGVTSAVMNITVNAVNDVPVATGNTVIATEDVPLVIGPGDFSFTDVDSDSLVSVTITGLNLNGGTLTHSAGAVTVTNGMTITAAQLADLTFTSALNDSTDCSFTYTVNDAGTGVTSAVMNITVNAVNNAPATTPVTLTAISEDGGGRLITQAELLANATDVDGPALTATNIATVALTVNPANDDDPTDNSDTNPIILLLEDPVTDDDEDSDVESPTYEAPAEDSLTEDEVVSPVEAIQTPQDSGDTNESILEIKDPQDEETQDIIYLTDEIDRNTQPEERDDDRAYIYYDNDLYKDISLSKYLSFNGFSAENEPVAVSLDDFSILDLDSEDTAPVVANEDYDALRQEIDESFNHELKSQGIKAKIVTATAATFTVGLVSYLLRAGSLVASMMSALPLWRGFDPIAIFSGDKKKKKKQDEISDTGELKPEAIFDGDAE